MTITRQQVDAWDAEVNAAYERGRQEGMKQERALWTLTKVGQEIEAQPVSWTGNGSAERREINAPTGFFFQVDKRLEEDDDIQDYKKPVGRFAKFTDGIWREVTEGSAGVPLHTSPPKREWVGLTDEEIWKVSYDFTESEGFRQGAYWAQNELKEKNQ